MLAYPSAWKCVSILKNVHVSVSAGPTFGFGWTALAELENDAVWAHGLLLVEAKQRLKAAKVFLGPTEVEGPAVRAGDLAVLVFHSVVHLGNTGRDTRVSIELEKVIWSFWLFLAVPQREKSKSICWSLLGYILKCTGLACFHTCAAGDGQTPSWKQTKWVN